MSAAHHAKWEQGFFQTLRHAALDTSPFLPNFPTSILLKAPGPGTLTTTIPSVTAIIQLMTTTMSASFFDGGLSTAVDHLMNTLPETLEKLAFPLSPTSALDSGRAGGNLQRHHRLGQRRGVTAREAAAPVDILETPKAYTFFLDVPGLSKSNIQVTLEDEAVLAIASSNNGKRKRDEGDEEGRCKYLLLERRSSPKFERKFRLPEDSDPAAIEAKCENGVLTVTVQKRPLPPREEAKPKTVQVAVQ